MENKSNTWFSGEVSTTNVVCAACGSTKSTDNNIRCVDCGADLNKARLEERFEERIMNEVKAEEKHVSVHELKLNPSLKTVFEKRVKDWELKYSKRQIYLKLRAIGFSYNAIAEVCGVHPKTPWLAVNSKYAAPDPIL